MFWRCVKLMMLSLLCFLCFNSCVTSTFIEGIDDIIEKHKTIAILPPKVAECGFSDTIDVNSFYGSNKQRCAYYLQKYMYEYSLLNKERYFVDIQDIKTTNFLLLEKSILYDDLEKLNRRTLPDLLGVDAVIRLEFGCGIVRSGGRINAGYVSHTTTYIDVNGVIFTANKGIWKIEGAMSITTECHKNIKVIKALIRKTIRQLPYRKGKRFADH